MASQGGVNYPKNRGARGVLFMDNTPGDMDNIGKECRLPLIYTSLAHPELIASIQLYFGHYHMVTIGNPHVYQLSI